MKTAKVHVDVKPRLKVKKGDKVMVIAGNDKGKTGEVKLVVREKGRVVVDGVNLRWKHRKPSQKNPKGERVQIEVAIHASNVMHIDPKTGKPTRKHPARDTARESKKK